MTREKLGVLKILLLEHLDEEERIIVPLLKAHWKQEEWEAVAVKMRKTMCMESLFFGARSRR